MLQINAAMEIERLQDYLGQDILARLHRRGAVVGCSGGVDSSVVLALCVGALGPEKVLAVLLPEKESNPDSLPLAQGWARTLGVETVVKDITETLEAAGCYQRRDEAISRIFPDYGPGWKCKITLPGSLLDQDTLNVFSLTVVRPDGQEFRERILSTDYYQVVAASNFKQRTRMAMLYYYAELQHFAVVGTANKNEHDLGFFVKHGDAGVDVSPIRHLFKSQVYQLAEVLGVPYAIRSRAPTSDTYSAGSTQEEFFFRLPFDLLDQIWAGQERGVPVPQIAEELGLREEQVQRVIDDLVRKQRTTEYLRAAAIGYEPEPAARGNAPNPVAS